MKKLLVLFLLIIAITVSIPIFYRINNNRVIYNGFLKVDGTKLKNRFGQEIQLKGVSSHGVQWEYTDIITKENLKYLRDEWDMNVFRIAMYTEEGGYINDKETNKQKVISIIDICIDLDIYVVVDWHNLKDGDPNKNKEAAREFFEFISEKYKNVPNVIYEICNEPNGVLWTEHIKPYANEIIEIIRKNTPKSLIIVGTPDYSKDIVSVVNSKLEYNNILYAFHFYASTHTEIYRQFIKYALENDVPVFVSEWGTGNYTGDGGFDYVNSEEWMKFLDENNISWINWSFSYKDESTAIVKPDIKDNINIIEENLTDSGKYIKNKMKKP